MNDEILSLRVHLEDAENRLRAIRADNGDPQVIQSRSGPRVFIPLGQDAEANWIRGEMLAQVSDAVVAVNDRDCVIYLNAAAERLFGLQAPDALGHPLADLYETRWPGPDDEASARAALRDRGEWRGEYVHVRPDGGALNVETSVTLLKDRDGVPSGRLAVIRDVTERKRHEHDVSVSELRYRRLFEAAQDGIVIIDPSTRKIIDANPFMTKMLGYRHDQLVGKELFEIGLLKDRAQSQEMVRKLKRSNQVRYENLPLKRRDGRHQEVEVIANLYEENGWPVIQCNIRDITARKLAEQHVQLLMSEVNHRAKNLLAVVQAVAHHTAKYGDPLTFAARLSDRIDGLAAGQDLLVKNQWQGVEAADLVEVQLAHFKDLVGTRILIDGPPSLLTMAAAQGIGMALHELTTNAAKYGALSNPDGIVRIAWRTTGVANPVFSISWVEEGGPKVAPPTRAGFGQSVIGRMAEAAVDGVVDIQFAERGLRWSLSAPAQNALSTSAEATTRDDRSVHAR